MTDCGDSRTRQLRFAAIKKGVVAVALGFPDKSSMIGPTQHPPSGLFSIVGSGFVLDRSGLVITAGHVVEQLHRAKVSAQLASAKAPDLLCVDSQVGFIDADGDLSVRLHTWYVHKYSYQLHPDIGFLKIGFENGRTQCEPLALSDAPAFEGDNIAICGYPMGLRLQQTAAVNASFSSGIVSAVLPSGDAPPTHRIGLQLDAVTHGGSSGAPVFSVDTGRVVGMVNKNLAVEVPTLGGPDDKSLAIFQGFTFAVDLLHLRMAYEHAQEGVKEVESETNSQSEV